MKGSRVLVWITFLIFLTYNRGLPKEFKVVRVSNTHALQRMEKGKSPIHSRKTIYRSTGARKSISQTKSASSIPFSLTKAFSDLSVDRIYLKDCYIRIVIRNQGKGGVSDQDYVRGKLVVEVKKTGDAQKWKKYTFSLKEIDLIGVLKKPKTQVDFNTKVFCISDVQVKARIEGLKGDAKRGRKLLVQNLSPSRICKTYERVVKKIASTSMSGVSSPQSVASSFNGGSDVSKIGKTLQKGPSSQDMEKPRAFEKAEKMQKIKTLEAAKGQRAFEAQQESRGRWQEGEFRSSSSGRINPYGGPIRDKGLFGSKGPSFSEWWEKQHKTQGMPGGPRAGSGMPMGPRFETGWAGRTKPKAGEVRTKAEHIASYTHSFSEYFYFPGDHLNSARFKIVNGYFAQKDGNKEQAEMYYKAAADDLKKYYDADGCIIDVSDNGIVVITLINPRKNTQSQDTQLPLQPEQWHKRSSTPWAPHQKSVVERKEEAQGIERTPHAVNVYHYGWEKGKKASKRSGGLQVNPGHIVGKAGEISHSNQGAETVWRIKTWATDPDFPTSFKAKHLKQQMHNK